MSVNISLSTFAFMMVPRGIAMNLVGMAALDPNEFLTSDAYDELIRLMDDGYFNPSQRETIKEFFLNNQLKTKNDHENFILINRVVEFRRFVANVIIEKTKKLLQDDEFNIESKGFFEWGYLSQPERTLKFIQLNLILNKYLLKIEKENFKLLSEYYYKKKSFEGMIEK